MYANYHYMKQDSSRPTCCSQRWIFAYMGAWLGVMQFLLSMNMSVTVVCMVKEVSFGANGSGISQTEYIHDIPELKEGSQAYDVLRNVSVNVPSGYVRYIDMNDTSAMHEHQTGEFTWNKKEQSFILSGYFYSYGAAQIPGGWLGAKYGGRGVVGISMTVACLMTLLTPIMARTSLYLVVVARILLGMCLAVVLPTFCGLVGAWALPTERSRMIGIICIGQTFGALLAYSTSGILCVHGFDNGWASVFYIHGMVGVAFVVCWWYFVYNSPSEHPRISDAEIMLILNHTKTNDSNKKKPPIPWKKILTHFPLYISYVAHICDAWTFYLLLVCLPQYLKEVLHFDIQSNGLLSCLPLVSSMVGIGIAGAGADFVRIKTKFTITTIRKLFVIAGFVGVGCFMIAPGFLTSENRSLAIMCICFCTLFLSLEAVGGFGANSVEIAPKYASIIYGISNTLATIPGAVAPIMVAVITKNQTVEEWRIIFYIAAGVSVFACIVYGLFANNEPTKWGEMHEDIELDEDIPITSVLSNDGKSDMDI